MTEPILSIFFKKINKQGPKKIKNRGGPKKIKNQGGPKKIKNQGGPNERICFLARSCQLFACTLIAVQISWSLRSRFKKKEVKLNIVSRDNFPLILFSGVGDDAGVQDQHPSDRSLWHSWQHSQYRRAQVYIQHPIKIIYMRTR